MKPHELLRQAALILADGWSHNTNARDHADRIVPLWVELLRQAALILTGGWSKNADARDDADRIVPLWVELLRQAALILHRRFNLGGNTIL
jgi:hypothetical protein